MPSADVTRSATPSPVTSPVADVTDTRLSRLQPRLSREPSAVYFAASGASFAVTVIVGPAASAGAAANRAIAAVMGRIRFHTVGEPAGARSAAIWSRAAK